MCMLCRVFFFRPTLTSLTLFSRSVLCQLYHRLDHRACIAALPLLPLLHSSQNRHGGTLPTYTMSGGFFRGTSADQDTRFSNKMKKLLKSQKFAPELDVTIDTSKVQMDVIKPWVATRVTELLGFEDEVLINFIYGMLEEKNVDGKHVQIQLTGFMEKNTGKFMKELWSLLISAQSNVSGIPQQFLDQKAEETRLKKVESERIAAELQRKRDLDKVAEDERQREKDAAAEAAKKVKEANGLADNDRVSKHSDDIRSGRGNGHFRRSVSKGRSSPGRNSRRRQRSRQSSDSSLSRYSRSVSRSPRRRRRSFSPGRPSRVSRVLRSPVRRSYSRSPIRRRKSPPAHRSPVRRRYASRSPPARRSSSYSLSPAPRSRARSPRRRNGGHVRREFRSPERVNRPGVRERRLSSSPGFRGPEPHQIPPVATRRPTGFGDRATPQDGDDWRAVPDRDGIGSTGDKRVLGDRDEKNVGPVEAREVGGENKMYSGVVERKTGSDRGVREKKDKWSHCDLNEEEGEPRRGGRDVVGEERFFTDMEERRSGYYRSVKNTRERWVHNVSNEGQKEAPRASTGVPGEKRPHSEIERNTGVDRSRRDSREEDRYYDDNGRSVQDRFRKDGGNGKRDMDLRREDRYFTDQRDRPTMRERSPSPDRLQVRKETRGSRKVVKSLQSPAKERRSEDYGRRSVEFDDDDSGAVRENVSKKSRVLEAEDDGLARDNDEDSFSPRGNEERRKEEKRRRKEEKRLRREERHKRKREEKQKRKDKKLSMSTGGLNGEDKRDNPEGTEQIDEEYDQKQREDELRHAALESLRAKKAISH